MGGAADALLAAFPVIYVYILWRYQLQLAKAINNIVEASVRYLEAKDPYTAFHSDRVAAIARDIALEMGLPPDQVNAVQAGAKLHDIGKLKVPEAVLRKEGGLSPGELRGHKTFVVPRGTRDYRLIPELHRTLQEGRALLGFHDPRGHSFLRVLYLDYVGEPDLPWEDRLDTPPGTGCFPGRPRRCLGRKEQPCVKDKCLRWPKNWQERVNWTA